MLIAICLDNSLTSCVLRYFSTFYEAGISSQNRAQAKQSSASAVLETASTSGLNSVRPSISLSQSSGVGVKVFPQPPHFTKRCAQIGATPCKFSHQMSVNRLVYVSQVVGVRKEYKTRGGVYIGADGIDLEIQAGKMTALLGPSGSGRFFGSRNCDV